MALLLFRLGWHNGILPFFGAVSYCIQKYRIGNTGMTLTGKNQGTPEVSRKPHWWKPNSVSQLTMNRQEANRIYKIKVKEYIRLLYKYIHAFYDFLFYYNIIMFFSSWKSSTSLQHLEDFTHLSLLFYSGLGYATPVTELHCSLTIKVWEVSRLKPQENILFSIYWYCSICRYQILN